MRLKKIEHQGDALLRTLKLEEMGRVGDEVVVEYEEVAQVHTRQKRERLGGVGADGLGGTGEAIEVYGARPPIPLPSDTWASYSRGQRSS